MSIGYGIGSWILLEYAHRVSNEIRSKSHFCNIMHWSVIIIQFILWNIIIMLILGNYRSCSFSYSVCSQFSLATIIMLGNFHSNSFHGIKQAITKLLLFYFMLLRH